MHNKKLVHNDEALFNTAVDYSASSVYTKTIEKLCKIYQIYEPQHNICVNHPDTVLL